MNATERPMELSKWQKRQAAMLYHFTSKEYLLGLKQMLDDFVAGVDITLDQAQREGRDRVLVSKQWGVRDTVANFDTYGFPAIKEFQMTVNELIASIPSESYGGTCYYQCSRVLGELSMNWSTPEEQRRFDAGMEALGKYAQPWDNSVTRSWDDSLFNVYWAKNEHLFTRLPKFKVRTDIEGASDAPPPKTGVYVPQDDPYGSLAFAWTGYPAGDLIECKTFNVLGRQAVHTVGRDKLWTDDPRLLTIVKQPQHIKAYRERCEQWGDKEDEYMHDANTAMVFVSVAGITTRTCKWYYVELIEGEYEDAEDDVAEDAVKLRMRGEPGTAVPRSGWWFSPAMSGDQGRQYFAQGARFPETRRTDWGDVIWSLETAEPVQAASDDTAWQLETEVLLPLAEVASIAPVAPTQSPLEDLSGQELAIEGAANGETAPTSSPKQLTTPIPSNASPATVELGELIATGQRCPCTGWWECAEVALPVRGGRRQYFSAGEMLPQAVLLGDPSLWQRLTKAEPEHRVDTVWKLVEIEA